jgi:hypothetical protein
MTSFCVKANLFSRVKKARDLTDADLKKNSSFNSEISSLEKSMQKKLIRKK